MNTRTNRVAAVQMVSTADIDQNIATAERLIAQAVTEGAGLVVLPENFAVLDGGPQAQFAEAEAQYSGLLQGFLSSCAREQGIFLVAGTIPLITRPADPGQVPHRIDDGRVRPACLVFDAEGRIVARYDKMHLFDVEVSDKQARYAESDSFEAGDQVVAVDSCCGRLGLSICYDLRFPELYRQLLARGAELITVPSAFTQVTGEAHWQILLRARAIENQCYVIGAAQGGRHNERRETFGHSMIIDPWGNVLGMLEKGEGVVCADIDLEQLHTIRRKMPVQQHRRL